MTKSTYLDTEIVKKFIEWLANNLETKDFAHEWCNRRTGKLWRCESVYNALCKYKWGFNINLPNGKHLNGNSFLENTTVLGILSENLRKAVEEKNDCETLKWGLCVLRWGGVYPANGTWLINHKNGLAGTLRKNVDILSSNDDDNLSNIERFNSGMTKIYSLLIDNFIIYDTRVAAALGWLIVRFCRENKREQVPSELQFPYGLAKEAANVKNPKQRNPSFGRLIFPRLHSGPIHARANLRANWLLNQVLMQSPDSGSKCEKMTTRGLEAALFMIGYDLGTPNQPPQNNTIVLESGNDLTENNLDFQLETRGGKGRRRKFNYSIIDDAIIITNENNRQDCFSFKEIHNILISLYRQFKFDWFPLANNVQKLGNGTEQYGLGRAILNLHPQDIAHAQAASYLGPIFEDLGFAEWNEKHRGIEWRLLESPQSNLNEFINILIQIWDA